VVILWCYGLIKIITQINDQKLMSLYDAQKAAGFLNDTPGRRGTMKLLSAGFGVSAT
jgi:hypothetical protein